MKRILSAFTLLLLLTSCLIREVELDYPPVPSRIVLNASVSPEYDVSAFVSKTWFLLDSVPDSFLPDVELKVSVNGVYKGLMQCVDTPLDTIPTSRGQYRLAGCRLQAGDRLSLEASAPGYETVSAEVSVPPHHPILSADTVSFLSMGVSSYYSRSEGLRFLIGMKKMLPGHNYYRILVEQRTVFERDGEQRIVSSYGTKTYSDYYKTYQPVDYEDPLFRINGVPTGSDNNYGSGIFTDNMLDEEEVYNLRLSLTWYDKSYRSDTLSSTVFYIVHLQSISESYYEYFRAFEYMGVWLGVGGWGNTNWADVGNRAETYTNVVNGFGVLTAYQQDVRSFQMPCDTIPPVWDPWNGFASHYSKKPL